MLKPYGSPKNWKKISGSESEDENGSKLITVAIGESQNQEGKTTYIKESIYADIMQEIIHNPDGYKIISNHGRVPQLCIISDSENIVPHNAEMMKLVGDLKKELSEILDELVCDALSECWNTDAEDRLSLNLLSSQVSRDLGYQVPGAFLNAVLRDYWTDLLTPGTTVGAVLSSMNFDQLSDMAAEANRFQAAGSFKSPETAELVEMMGASPEELVAAIKDELFSRLITRKIKGKN